VAEVTGLGVASESHGEPASSAAVEASGVASMSAAPFAASRAICRIEARPATLPISPRQATVNEAELSPPSTAKMGASEKIFDSFCSTCIATSGGAKH
jgi:hypothetical protein